MDIARIDHEQLWRTLQRFAGTLVERYSLERVLEQLGADVRGILEVAGAGVMLEDDDGYLRFVSTSDGTLHELEGLQIELGEGPCLLAYRTAEPVIAGDLTADERFPQFGPRAAAAGMAAVHSFPMSVQGTAIGALNVYRPRPGWLDPEQVEAGHVLADIATVYLVHADDVEQSKLLGERLQRSLHTMVVVEQAKGYVIGKLGVGLMEAREMLRVYARSNRVKLEDVAQRILEGDLDVDRLPRGGSVHDEEPPDGRGPPRL